MFLIIFFQWYEKYSFETLYNCTFIPKVLLTRKRTHTSSHTDTHTHTAVESNGLKLQRETQIPYRIILLTQTLSPTFFLPFQPSSFFYLGTHTHTQHTHT